MNRRTFMMGLFGIAGTAVCAGKAVAGDAMKDFDPAQFKNFGGKLNKTLKDIEEAQERLNDTFNNCRPGDVLMTGMQNDTRITTAMKRAMGDYK